MKDLPEIVILKMGVVTIVLLLLQLLISALRI